jgi:predicted lipoprotein with Yx(FWY)xxD motif
MLARTAAPPSGDWSVVARADGARQWAYRGKPLYRSAKDAKPGDTNGGGTDGKWHVALFAQTPDEVASPAGITLKAMVNAGGDVFVDYRGMTLYVFDGDQDGKSACVDACLKIWTPLAAGELAKPTGDWSIARRADGSRQWAFKGRPVYGFSGDAKSGEANGLYFDRQWHAAALRRYFSPAGIAMRINGGWPVLATADGRTLYARDRYRYPGGGGFSVNDGPPPTPTVGRSIGTAACPGGCADMWVPMKAGADDQPSGYWSIALRDDGTRQWAYQGYALYTNAQDKKPGDELGRDIFDLTDGSHALYWRVAMP